MFYYLYKIRNKISDRVYIGVHTTNDMNDGYMGSGKLIRRAIKKHGTHNFEKEIVEMFNDKESMYDREKEVVTNEFLRTTKTYNIKCGGDGGFDQRYSVMGAMPGRIAADKVLEEKYGSDWRSIVAIAANSGKAMVKKKQTFADIAHQQGASNSQFGTCWMWHDLVGNKKCKKENLPLFIEQGWAKGRK